MTNREIDALVAEKVMGWDKKDVGEGCFVWTHQDEDECIFPYYSTFIKAAWEVVETLKHLYIGVSYCDSTHKWTVCLMNQKWVYGKTAPITICKAALRDKGIDID